MIKTTGRTLTNGIQTYYEHQGNGDETLVFIHGLGSEGSDWQHQVPHFSRWFKVITYDVRGFGKSDKPPGPYSIKLFAEDLAALLAALKTGPVHLCGVSMGGWIAYQFTLDHPGMVKSLCTVNSMVELIPRDLKSWLRLLQRKFLFRILTMDRIGKILAPKLFPKPEQEAIRRAFVEKWGQNHKPSYMAAFNGALGWSIKHQLSHISCPVLLIAAEHDYTPIQTQKDTASALKFGKLVVIKDSRHGLPVEKPKEFNEALASFLKEHLDKVPV